MKKLFFSVVVLVLTATVTAFGQILTEEKIYDPWGITIKMKVHLPEANKDIFFFCISPEVQSFESCMYDCRMRGYLIEESNKQDLSPTIKKIMRSRNFVAMLSYFNNGFNCIIYDKATDTFWLGVKLDE